MKDPTTGRRAYGRTRWRRFGILLAPAFTAVAVMMYMVATGAIAVSFAISGIPFTLNAANLSGNGFVQYATVDPDDEHCRGSSSSTRSSRRALATQAPSPQSAAHDAATVTVLHDGTITGLDQTICVPLQAEPLGNRLLVELKAGQSAGSPVSLLDTGSGRSAADRNRRHVHQHRYRTRCQEAINHYVPASGINRR